MNEIIVVVVLVAEILTVLQCLQIAFMQELKFDKYMAIIIVADILLYSAITFGLLPKICSVLFYVLVFVYCYFKFKQKMAKTVISYIIGLSLVGCVEAMAACILNLLSNFIEKNVILLFSSFIALIISGAIRTWIPILKVKKLGKRNVWILVCLIFYILAYGVLIVDYYFNQTFIKVYAIFILTFLVLMALYFYKLMQAQNEISIKNQELELQKIYGGMYEDLLREIRKRQHDYKNQLGAIYSMHMIAKSNDELEEMQKKYINSLEMNSRYDSILTKCTNPILGGYLYYRCLMCEEENISVNLDILVNCIECCIPLHEIIEVLGILIDNACENLVNKKKEEKAIGIYIVDNKDMIKIAISNPAESVSYFEIENMFIEGYSTKGDNRGLGLPRCLELVRKYGSEIYVKNILINNCNWIEFVIEIEK